MQFESHHPDFVIMNQIVINVNEIEYLSPKDTNRNHTTIHMKSKAQLHTRYSVAQTAEILRLNPAHAKNI